MLIADRYTQVYNGAMGRGFKSKASRAQLGNAWQVIRGSLLDIPREDVARYLSGTCHRGAAAA